MKVLPGLLILLTLSFCKQQEAKQEVFQLPAIVQPTTTDTVFYFDAHNITENNPQYAGKFKFGDTLKLSTDKDQVSSNDTSALWQDIIWGITSKIAWTTDTIQYGYDPFEQDSLQKYYTLYTDSMKSDGLELFTDYESSIVQIDFMLKKYVRQYCRYYYPVHVVNQTPSIKMIYGMDRHVSAIQEALDSDGRWRPIEQPSFVLDLNGRWALKIHPKEFFTFLMPKYKGDFKTRIRVRFKVGDMIYVSKPFTGNINKDQFYIALYGKVVNASEKEEYMGQRLWYLEGINQFYGTPLTLDDILKK